MKDILARIAATKRLEVEGAKKMMPAEALSEIIATGTHTPVSLAASVKSAATAIIAEHKRASPSRGPIAPMSDVRAIASAYASAGAAGMSVLTDTPYFGGSLTDLMSARQVTRLPLLRKDFVVDPYQLLQARVCGADAVLLIAAMLSPGEIASLADRAHSLGLEVLLEFHTREEAAAAPVECADLVGVNNRNLRDFSTSTEASIRLADALPADAVRIAESGIHTGADIRSLKQAGFSGFLIGEALMSTPDPGLTLARLIAESR